MITHPCCGTVAGKHSPLCPLLKLSASQQEILGKAARKSLPGDGVRVKGARVGAARALEARGLVRVADFTHDDAGVVVHVTPEGKRLGMTIDPEPTP